MFKNNYVTVKSEITFFYKNGVGLRPKYKKIIQLMDNYSSDMQHTILDLSSNYKSEVTGMALINEFYKSLKKLIVKSNEIILHIRESQLDQYIKMLFGKIDKLLRSLNKKMNNAKYYGSDFCESFWGTLLFPSIDWIEHLQKLNHARFITFHKYFQTYKGV